VTGGRIELSVQPDETSGVAKIVMAYSMKGVISKKSGAISGGSISGESALA